MGSWQSWETLDGIPQGVQGQPWAAADPQKRLHIVARSTDNRLWHRWHDSFTWHDWHSDNTATITTDPVAVVSEERKLDAFVLGADSHLWHWRWETDGRVMWDKLGDFKFISPPYAISSQPGQIDLFARRDDLKIWHRRRTPAGWGEWDETGDGVLTSQPIAVSRGTAIDVYAIGAEKRLWRNQWNGFNWGGWHVPGTEGGVLEQVPAVLARGTDKVDIFARGTDNKIYRKWYRNDNWLDAWEEIPEGRTITTPAAIGHGSAEHLQLFTVGETHALWTAEMKLGLWGAWTNLGGHLASAPVIARWSDERIDIIARGGENQVIHTWYQK